MRPITTTVHYSVELLRSNPEKIFVFGDNLIRRGRGGQAVIRGEPNAFGVPTKRAPSMALGSFFSDQQDEDAAVVAALRQLFVISQSKTVVFPAAGLGTGLAQMSSRSPTIYRKMQLILQEHFAIPGRPVDGLLAPVAVTTPFGAPKHNR